MFIYTVDIEPAIHRPIQKTSSQPTTYNGDNGLGGGPYPMTAAGIEDTTRWIALKTAQTKARRYQALTWLPDLQTKASAEVPTQGEAMACATDTNGSVALAEATCKMPSRYSGSSCAFPILTEATHEAPRMPLVCSNPECDIHTSSAIAELPIKKDEVHRAR